jgi:hypothetical protein
MLRRNIIALQGIGAAVETCLLAADDLLPCPQPALCLFIATE